MAGLEGLSSPATALRCPKCSTPFEPDLALPVGRMECSHCLSSISFVLFPAFHNPPEAISMASGVRAAEGEAVCFFHPEKRAECTCDRCGRFVCELCDLPFGNRHLCPKCMDTSKLPELVTSRFVGAYAAMLIGILPLFFPCFYFFPFTGTAAMILGGWSWKKPGSLVYGPRHAMAVVGVLTGFLQLLALVGIIMGFIYVIKHGQARR